MEKEITVLSLFDGLSCGQIALNRCGIKYDKYYASEIDKYSIKVTQANYPNTIQIGSLVDIKAANLPKIGLLIGGSPCQGFSFAGKGLNFEDPRSKLFFEYVRILKEIKESNPDVLFLLENVKMKKEHERVINKFLGCKPIRLNSALVSAQNRQRLYWTNIRVNTIPENKKIMLKDVLETDVADKYFISQKALDRALRTSFSSPKLNPNKAGTLLSKNNSGQMSLDSGTTLISMPDKSYCIDANYHKGTSVEDYLNKSRRQLVPVTETQCVAMRGRENGQELELNNTNKTNSLTSVQKDNLIITHNMLPRSSTNGRGGVGHLKKNDGKTYCLDTNPMVNAIEFHSQNKIRRLTEIECERLQTVPDNYTNHVSSTQRYKMLGNGFTVDIICHILKHMERNK